MKERSSCTRPLALADTSPGRRLDSMMRSSLSHLPALRQASARDSAGPKESEAAALKGRKLKVRGLASPLFEDADAPDDDFPVGVTSAFMESSCKVRTAVPPSARSRKGEVTKERSSELACKLRELLERLREPSASGMSWLSDDSHSPAGASGLPLPFPFPRPFPRPLPPAYQHAEWPCPMRPQVMQP